MNTADIVPRPLALEGQLCFALYSTLHAVGKTYAMRLPGLGLTYPQYLVMLVLWEGDDLRVKEIGERLYLDSGTLTPLLKRLEAAGLVVRVRDDADERQVRVRLTERGRSLEAKAGGIPDQIAQAMGRRPQDLATLRDDLISLRSNLIDSRCKADHRTIA